MGKVFLIHPICLETDLKRRAKIEGCIIGRSTRVSSKAELVKSITQHGYEVEAGGKRYGHLPQNYLTFIPFSNS